MRSAAAHSPLHSLPQLRQPLDRDRHRRLQLLREERHAQLLEQPAELLELRVGRAALALRRGLALPLRLERRELGGDARVARRIGAQLVEPQRRRLEIAREVLQPLPRRARDERPGKQTRELAADVLAPLPGTLSPPASFFCSTGCSARMVPTSRAISCAISVKRLRPSSRAARTPQRSRGSGSARKVRSNAAATSAIAARSRRREPANCSAIACMPGQSSSRRSAPAP